MSTFVPRKIRVKPMMNQEQHMAVIKMLKKRKYREMALKFLVQYRINDEFADEIEDNLADLCDTRYSEIADWIWRQWQNSAKSDKPDVQPSEFPVEKVVVKERLGKPHFQRKAESLRLTYFKKMYKNKIEKNPKDFERQRSMERIQSMIDQNLLSVSSLLDFALSFMDCLAPPISPLNTVGRGKKRSYEEGYC